MWHSALICVVILPSTINIFLIIAELCPVHKILIQIKVEDIIVILACDIEH